MVLAFDPYHFDGETGSIAEPTKLIVGVTSQPGGVEYSLAKSEGKGNTVGTGSKVVKSTLDGETVIDSDRGVKLNTEGDIIKSVEGLREVLGDILVLGKPLDITLHAMSMAYLSEDYPAELVTELERIGAIVNSLTLISYEAPFSEEHPTGSHVFYPVRGRKTNIEDSAIRVGGKVIDLITFDSPSAKVLGFTFLGVIGDFAQFLEAHPHSQITQIFGKTVKDFLGDNYTGIIDAFEKYPIRGPLSKGQESMKELAEKQELGAAVNNIMSSIEPGYLSFISGLITELYLLLAVHDYNVKIDAIMNSPDARTLQSWEKIASDNLQGVVLTRIQDIHRRLVDKINIKRGEGQAQNLMYLETGRSEDQRRYTLDPAHLGTISGHFGTGAYMMLENLGYNTELLPEGKYISGGSPTSLLFAGDDIKATIGEGRGGKYSITIDSDSGKRESFTTLVIKDRPTEDPEGPMEGFDIPIENKEVDPSSFPHSMEWAEAFFYGIPKSYNGMELNPLSAIVEHIGFKIQNMLMNNPDSSIMADLVAMFPGMKDFSKGAIAGKYAKIEKDDLHPDFEELLMSHDPKYHNQIQIKIIGAKFVPSKRGLPPYLVVNTEERIGDTVISRHTLRFN